MRYRNREISIFSLSTLDVIFGALGAFMILMLAAMAGYNPDVTGNEAELQEEVAEERQAQRMFFAVANWADDVDVDLWVDANGRMFGPKVEPFDDLPEEQMMVGDETDGGWESFAQENASGSYRVLLRLHDFKTHEGRVVVRGWVIANSYEGQYSTRPFWGVRLDPEDLGEMIEVARFELDDAGRVVDGEMTYGDERFSP